MLLGAWKYDETYTDRGKAYLILASIFSPTVALSNSAASFLGESDLDYVGVSCGTSGGVNNDGLDDFLISAYTYNNTGRVYLNFGVVP